MGVNVYVMGRGIDERKGKKREREQQRKCVGDVNTYLSMIIHYPYLCEGGLKLESLNNNKVGIPPLFW